jgi:hypothetical protein
VLTNQSIDRSFIAPCFFEDVDEPLVVPDDAQDVAVEEDGEDLLVRQLLARQQVHILHAHVEGEPELMKFSGIFWGYYTENFAENTFSK